MNLYSNRRHHGGGSPSDSGGMSGGASVRSKSGGGGASVGVMGVRIPKKVAISLLAASGLLAFLGPDLSALDGMLHRDLAVSTICINNIYIDSFEDAVMMPPPGPTERDADYVPTHIKMCYEWLRRDALSVDGAIVHRTNILEHRDVCLDWSAPHYAMMEILANSVLHTVLPRIRYRHGCPSHRTYEESLRGYDWSTFQSVFQEPAMAVDQSLVDTDLFREQCKYCLAQYDPAADANRIRSRAFHHCFAFPEESSLYKDPYQLPPGGVTVDTLVPLPSYPDPSKSSAPIAAILNPLKTRVFHSAIEWLNVTDRPPAEAVSGTVIMIDPGTLGVEPEVLERFINPQTTSISILAGPLCYSSVLPTNGEVCAAYGERLRQYFDTNYPQLSTNGYKGSPGVDFQISASTAGTMSRAILANDLLCPPRTASCLLPPLGKKPPAKSTLLSVPCPDCPGSGVPEVRFFENVGVGPNTDVYLLPDPDRPPITEGTPSAPSPPAIPPGNPDFPLSPDFPNSQKPTTGDGYPDDGSPVPAPVDIASLPTLPSYDAYKNVEPKLPPSIAAASSGNPEEDSPIGQTPGVQLDYSNTEKIPSAEEIQDAIDNNEPLDVNTPPDAPAPDGSPSEPVDPSESMELATDESAGLVSRPLEDESYKELAVERRNSKDRIVTGYDGNYLFEVPCPGPDDVGGALVLEDGVTLTEDPETQDTVVADGVGTVIFEGNVTIDTAEVIKCTVTDPITGLETEDDCVEIDDIIHNSTINVTAGGLTSNPDSGVEVTNNVGQLVTNPHTGDGCLVTMGEMATLKKKDTPKTHTVIKGKVKNAGNENIPPSDTGTVVMDEGAYAVTQESEGFHGFIPVDPLDGNSGLYQHFIASPLETSVQSVPFDQCQIQPGVDFPNPIYIRLQTGSMVMFDTAQTFKSSEISWVAVATTDMYYGGDYHCMKHEEVPYGLMSNSRRAAICTQQPNGRYEAEVDIIIHDGSKRINQLEGLPPAEYDITPYIHPTCQASNDYGNKCKFKYRLDCMGDLPPVRRRRLAEGTPVGVVPDVTDDDRRFLFTRSILDKCPELGNMARGRVFKNFIFGGGSRSSNKDNNNIVAKNGEGTRKIPVHVKGMPPVFPAKVARALNAPPAGVAA